MHTESPPICKRHTRISVLVVDNATSLGGVAMTLRHVIPLLEDAGFDVTIAVSGSSAEGADWYARAGIRVLPVDLPPARSPGSMLRGARAIVAAARQTGAQLVHAHGTRAALAAVAARPFLRIPVVLSLHEGHVPLATRLAAPLASLVLYRSRDQRSRHRWLRRGHMRLVYAGVVNGPSSGPRIPRQLREELGFPPEASLVAQFGTLTWWKGHDVFIRAAARVSEQVPDVRFVICGGPSQFEPALEGELRDLAESLGLGNRLRFLGFRTDASEILDEIDVLVHAIVFPESFGLVVAEAMAHGVPVVVSDLGSMVELVDDGMQGFRVPPGDSEAVAHAVCQLLSDPALRDRLGSAGIARHEERFRLEDEVAAYVALYQELTVPT